MDAFSNVFAIFFCKWKWFMDYFGLHWKGEERCLFAKYISNRHFKANTMHPYQIFTNMVPCRPYFFIIFFVIFLNLFAKGDVPSQSLYMVTPKGNIPVIMTTTKATKPAISSHKLYQARQNRQIFKRMSFKLAACLRHIHTSQLHNCYSYVNDDYIWPTTKFIIYCVTGNNHNVTPPKCINY